MGSGFLYSVAGTVVGLLSVRLVAGSNGRLVFPGTWEVCVLRWSWQRGVLLSLSWSLPAQTAHKTPLNAKHLPLSRCIGQALPIRPLLGHCLAGQLWSAAPELGMGGVPSGSCFHFQFKGWTIQIHQQNGLQPLAKALQNHTLEPHSSALLWRGKDGGGSAGQPYGAEGPLFSNGFSLGPADFGFCLPQTDSKTASVGNQGVKQGCFQAISLSL